jgi:predicted site-specific integrase-resolvase
MPDTNHTEAIGVPPKRLFAYHRAATCGPGGVPSPQLRLQIAECDHLAARLGGVIIDRVMDIGSGMNNSGLPGFQRMLTAIRNRGIDGIVTTDIFRLGRRSDKLATFIELCTRHDVEIWTVTAGRLCEIHVLVLQMAAIRARRLRPRKTVTDLATGEVLRLPSARRPLRNRRT